MDIEKKQSYASFMQESARKYPDYTITVDWWHRNEPRKPWAVGIVMPDGDRYFPDFVVGVNDRHHNDGVLLVETKGAHIINYGEPLEKINAEHKHYGKPLMLTRQDDGRFLDDALHRIDSENRTGSGVSG